MQAPSSAAPLRLLGLSGSLREGSLNRALLRTLQELAPDTLHVEIHDLHDVPLYDPDVEVGRLPEAVARLNAAIAVADGLLIATPEYNYSVPGVLKNALDWASRPQRRSPLAGKPAAILGASTGMGGTIRAQTHLRLILGATLTPVMLTPEVYVAQAAAKFDANGHLTDEATRTHLHRFLGAFEAFVRQARVLQPALAAQ